MARALRCEADPESAHNKRFPLSEEYRVPCAGDVRRYLAAAVSDPQAQVPLDLCAVHAAVQKKQSGIVVEESHVDDSGG